MLNPSQVSEFFVITIDGPSGAGKGTLTARLAEKFGFALLDSGALYRIVGLHAFEQGLLDNGKIDEGKLADLTHSLQIEFLPANKHTNHVTVLVNGRDVSEQIRTEQVGEFASKVAVFPKVRSALLDLQHDMANPEKTDNRGLIADGRDMGTVVFPHAQVKVFLIASPEARAERRVNQLQQAGKEANFDEIFSQIVARDERDSNRETSPSKPAKDAVVVDSSSINADTVFEQVLKLCEKKGLNI